MKIVLVEDSPLVRERLVAMVSELRGATIVGYAEDADRARESKGGYAMICYENTFPWHYHRHRHNLERISSAIIKARAIGLCSPNGG
jgi:hypothetical protein